MLREVGCILHTQPQPSFSASLIYGQEAKERDKCDNILLGDLHHVEKNY